MVELESKVEDNNVIGDKEVYENDTINRPPPKKQKKMTIDNWLKPVGKGKLMESKDTSENSQTNVNDKLIDINA